MFLKIIAGLTNVGIRLNAFFTAMISAVNAAKEFDAQLAKISHLIKEENEQGKC